MALPPPVGTSCSDCGKKDLYLENCIERKWKCGHTSWTCDHCFGWGDPNKVEKCPVCGVGVEIC